MKIALVDPPEGNVVGRGAYLGGPEYEFVVAIDGHIDFRVVGDHSTVWAGPSVEAFRKIVARWNRYQAEVQQLPRDDQQRQCVYEMRAELSRLGALPADMPPDPEPLWSLLVFEAEDGLS